MIDYKEVRVGNWAQRAGGGQPKMITVEDFWQYYVDPLKGFYYLEPIPLTPEILLACGFIKGVVGFQSNISIRKHKLLIFCVDIGLELITLSYGSDIGNSPHDVIVIHDGAFDGKLYLHNLQNLFFATTHQELIYKPTPQPA